MMEIKLPDEMKSYHQDCIATLAVPNIKIDVSLLQISFNNQEMEYNVRKDNKDHQIRKLEINLSIKSLSEELILWISTSLKEQLTLLKKETQLEKVVDDFPIQAKEKDDQSKLQKQFEKLLIKNSRILGSNPVYCDPNCQYCSKYGCSQCKSGYFLSSGICCMNGCQTCTNGYSCSTCPTGYYKSSSSLCIKCDPSCQTCSSGTSCNSCAASKYFLPSPSQLCGSCPSQGYYVDVQTNSCKLCNTGCSSCTGSSNNCTTCTTGYVLVPSSSSSISGTCVGCDLKNRQYISGTTCQSCNSACQTCTGSLSTDCLTCIAPKILNEQKVCVNCDTNNGYYIENNICKQCNSSCKTCIGGNSASNCTSCNTPLSLLNKTCIDCSQQPGYYKTDSNQCLPCDSSCASCTKAGNVSCTTCQSGLFFYPDNTCRSCQTNNGYFIQGNQCLKCDSSCLTCNNTTAGSCLSCKIGYSWFESNGNYYCGFCDPKQGYYVENGYCKKCDQSCQECIASQGQVVCTVCQGGLFFLNNDKSKCVECQQSQGYYSNLSTQECLKCDTTCSQCSDGSSTGCISCAIGLFWLEQEKKCVTCTDTNQILINNLCYSCIGNCTTCNIQNLSSCTSCPSGFFIHERLGTCVSCTGDGVFIDGSLCKECNSSCKTCSGILPNQCLSCQSGETLMPDNSCGICPSQNYFIQVIGSSSICTPCDSSCQTCQGSSSNCLICAADHSAVNGVNCPPYQCKFNEYLDANGICSQCDLSCNGCTGSGNDKCILCQSGYTNLIANQIQICTICNISDQHYINGQNCLQCDTSCKTCNGPSNKNCLSCPINFYLLNGECVACIDPGQYISGSYCLLCALNCDKCTGPTIDNCQICSGTKNFSETTHQCIDCPTTNYYIDNGVCKRCHQDCLTCTGPLSSDCLKCNNNLYNIQNKCQQCPVQNGYYVDSQTGQCLGCHSSCKSCTGNLETECTICKSDLYFFQGKCKSCDTQNGYFINLDQCIACHSTCKSCTTSGANDCTTCYGLKYLLLDGTCGDCPSIGYFISNGTCLQCHPDCKTCDGQGSNNCLSCTNNNYQVNGMTSTCQTCQITDGYFIDNNNICQQCNDQCITCNGKTSNDCLTCRSPNMLQPDNTCGDCTEDQYIVVSGQCQLCDSSCKKCNGVNSNQCTMCKDGYGFDQNSLCIPCSQIGHYIDPSDGKCRNCTQDCISCVNINNRFDFNCNQCQNGMLVDEITFQCVTCDTTKGNYIDGHYCRKCHSSCGSCNGNTNLDCTTCLYPLKKRIDATCQDCPLQNFFYDQNTQICYECQPNCAQCNSTTTCSQCQTGYNLDENTGKCVICDINNGYYISGLYCKKCDISCKTCTQSPKYCIKCKDNLFMAPNSSLCMPCPSKQGFFLDENNKCQYCYGLRGFQFDNSTLYCNEVCGKGFVSQANYTKYAFARSNVQCDDGNLIRYDGCSNNCQKENGYDCKFVEGINQSKKSNCTKVYTGAIPKLIISQDVTKIDDTYLLKGIIQFDRNVTVSNYLNWVVYLSDQANTTFSDYTYTIVPIKNQPGVLQDQQFQIVLRVNQNITGMNIKLVFPELSDVLDKNQVNLNQNQVFGTLPDINKLNNQTKSELLILKVKSPDSQKKNEISESVSIVLFCVMILFFASGQLYYIVHFYDLLQFAHYLVYLNISYPNLLCQLLHVLGFANFEPLPNITNSNTNAPLKFKLYNTDTLIFSNIIQLVCIWLVSFFIYLVSKMVMAKRKNPSNFLMQQLQIYKENYVYNIIIGLGILTYQEFILAALLQIFSFDNSEVINILGNLVAFIFLTLCGFFLIATTSSNILQPKLSSNMIFFSWKLKNPKSFLYITMIIRKSLMMFIIVFGKIGISQCLTLHMIMGVETAILIMQKPFQSKLEYKFQILKRVMLLLLMSLITLISYQDEDLQEFQIKIDILSVVASIIVFIFLISHVLYFARQVGIAIISFIKQKRYGKSHIMCVKDDSSI